MSLAPLASSCGGDDPAEVQSVASVTVSPGQTTIAEIGGSRVLTAAATYQGGGVVPGAEFVWDTGNPSVATVDEAGRVTAVGPGSAQVTATTEGVTGQATVLVDQAVDHLAFLVGPSGGVAGQALDPASQVEVLDPGGTRVADASIPITLALGTNPSAGTLEGTKTANAVNGVASFSGLSIDKSGAGYTLQAASAGVPSATSAEFDVDPAPAASLSYLPLPAATAGEPLGLGVAVVDAFGNTVTTATDEITIALSDGPAGGALLGTTTVSAVDGIATFDDVAIELAGDGYVVEANASGFASVLSNPFTVEPGDPHHLGHGSQSIGGDAKLLLDLSFGIRDAFGNLVEGATDPVTVSLSGGYPGASLSGDLTVNAVDGLAVFDDVSIDKPGRYDLTGVAAGLPDTTIKASVSLRPGPTFLSVEAGGEHSCVTSHGGVFCWGSNDQGQLGGPTVAPVGDSVAVAGDIGLLFDQVSAGTDHTCGIAVGDAGYCWGRNDEGQLGDGSGFDQPSPTVVLNGTPLQWISAGERHTCAVTTAGIAYCWGANDEGQLGIGTIGAGSETPVMVTDSIEFLMVSAGASHTCGLSAQTGQAGPVYCWGSNDEGQLGDDNLGTDGPSPVLVQGGPFFLVEVGARHSCGIDSGFAVMCWGSNDSGQLGNGGGSDSGIPVFATQIDIPLGSAYLGRLTAGAAHTCAINGPGAGVSCWGDDGFGQLGGGALVTGSQLVTTLAITAGGAHTCAYVDDLDGLLEQDAGDGLPEGYRCWGGNASGQLGDGTTTDASQPSLVIQGW